MNDKQIIKKLTEELEQETKPKWISVDERLPELRERVILFDNNGFGLVTGRRGTAEWYLEGDLDLNANITHWQPLPEPPK